MKKNITSSKVGILFDSYYKNTGDSAMGIVMKDILESNGIKYVKINPFDENKKSFDLIITGGGQIIRNPGNFYYDNFRVWGTHILNAVEVTNFDDLRFLEEYKYVTVRTSESAKKLNNIGIKAVCVPDICIAMKNKGTGIKIPENSIGVHLMPLVGQDNFRQHVSFVKTMIKQSKVVLIPVTHYAKDYAYLKRIHKLLPETILLEEHNPQIIFDTIGSLKMLVSMSLHAAIFAYTQRVNFIVWDEPLNRKMYEFFKDRKLEKRLFTNTSSMMTKAKYFIAHNGIGYDDQLKKDKVQLKKHFDKIIDLIKKTKPNPTEKKIYGYLSKLESEKNNMIISANQQDNKLLIANNNIRILKKELNNIKSTKSWLLIEKLNKYRYRVVKYKD